ncbi:AAA family ATPase [Maridesulfovibrio ferrireducens]|uniref:AAA family ATPase n=1 Tax=Maridesulfovibrio ferrireducens TaxID=246191 RepID=UPI000AC14506
MPLPKRGFLLKPVIPTQGLVIMYAPRGIGKTFAALSMALAISGGGEIFEWRASNQSRVLYVDGEMPAIAMQERLAYLAMGNNVPPNATNNLVLVTPDIQPCPMPDLSTYAGQQSLEPLLKDIALLVLDNIATLCRTGKENEAQSWQNMQSWLLDLRRRGIAVLIIHHAGKSGDQRGTSAREDIMDTVISLRRPKQYKMTEGARFEVHLTKARGISGEDVKPFEALLCSEKESFYWKIKDIEDAELDELKALLSEGLSIRDCAEEMGRSKSSVHRLKKKLEATN